VEYLTLIGQKEIRLHRGLKFFHTLDRMDQPPTGIHRPDASVFFVLPEYLGEVRRAATIRKVLDQGAVKICAQ
jgi:hypothetical protein